MVPIRHRIEAWRIIVEPCATAARHEGDGLGQQIRIVIHSAA